MIIEKSNKFGEIDLVLLERFEKEIGAKLPEQYREFLICHNGGKPVPCDFLISKRKGEDSIKQFYGLNSGPTYQRLNENYELINSTKLISPFPSLSMRWTNSTNSASLGF